MRKDSVSSMNDVKNPTRRGFLGLLAGALALPVVAPIAAPKRSFFSFFLPKREIEVVQEFDLQQEIDKLSKVGGGVVRIPEGVYVVGKSIILPDDVSFKVGPRAIVGSCHVVGKSKGTKNPRGIFVSEPGDEGDPGLVTGCFFDMNETSRPLMEFVIPKA